MLLVAWLGFEIGRPARPFGIPLLLSVALLIAWIMKSGRRWVPEANAWLLLLGVIVVSVPFASNTFAAYMAAKGMAILFLCICLPLQSILSNPRQVRVILGSLLAASAYVGAWAVLHGGYGPSGAAGSQDENYVAALMGMAFPFAYFGAQATRSLWMRSLLMGCMVLYVAAIALGQNPSRGGFIGLCAVGLYCVLRSRRRGVGLVVLAVAAIGLIAVAGPAFWSEIGTSADFQSGTADFRLELWKIGFRMWEANPLFGVGPGNFRWELGEYQSAAQFAALGRSLGGSVVAHSLYVELLAELGLVGLTLTGLIVWTTWRALARPRAQSSSSRGWTVDQATLWAAAEGTRGAILAILVNGVFLSLYYYSNLWLLLALGTALTRIYRGHSIQERQVISRQLRAEPVGL